MSQQGGKRAGVVVAAIGAVAVIIGAIITGIFTYKSAHPDIPSCGSPPSSATEVARRFGGSDSEWRQVTEKGWYHGGSAVSFTVPQGCLVDDFSGRHGGGTQISDTELTLYWT